MFPESMPVAHRVAVVGQTAFALLFLATFVFTFLSSTQIKSASRDIITDKVVRMTEPQVGVAEEILNSELAQGLLADHQSEALADEIMLFRQDPHAYVASLVQKDGNPVMPAIAVLNPLKRQLVDKIFGWKTAVKQYFDRTFNRLVLDLRIFTMTNVIGLLAAAWILIKSEEFGQHAVPASYILSSVIASSALNYIDQSWLFTILVNYYYGYSYPVGIVLSFGWLFYDHYRDAGR